jgi:PAS domain S-box-containing protein
MQFNFVKQYLTALQSYYRFPQKAEVALRQANELGHQAIYDGLAASDMAEIHQLALDSMLRSQKTLEECRQVVNQTWNFFRESILPYESSRRDFQYANATLQQLYHSLDQTVVEKTQELHESEEQYRLLIETMNEGLGVMNENLSLTYVNDKLCDMLAYSRDELLGHSINLIFDAVEPNFVTKQFAKHKKGDYKSFEINWLKKNGQSICTIVSPSNIFDVEGNFKGHFMVVTDITERKQASAAIEHLKRQNELILNSVGEGIYGLDKTFSTIFINPAACQMLGFQADELIGKCLHKIIHHTKSDGTAYPINECLTCQVVKSGSACHVDDEVFWRKDGTSFPVEYTSTPIRDENAEIKGVVVTFRDITERKQAQEALLKERASLAQKVEERTAELSMTNAELSRSVRLKDEFLANMSHELRTPLNAILARSEILQEEIFGELNEKQMNYVKTIENSGRHLLGLINDILDLSKIEAGQMVLEIEPLFVKSICQASMEFVKELALKKRLQVFTEIDSNVLLIQADQRRLKQILINLLNNAVKFTEEGQTMGLEVVGDKARETVHFTVWDTGIGIANADMNKLFQSFVQVDSRLSRRYEGTGLGLALVRRLTDMHGGNVSVESEIGKGSRFTVSLPWREPNQKEVTIPSEIDNTKNTTAAQIVKMNRPAPLILLAEDNESNILSISEYLRAKGYRVAIACNGKEAYIRALEERPSVILMDIQMPVMNGLEATQKIRADRELANVPIIALTALVMPGDKEQCLAAGVNEYLSKPVPLKSLVELIEKQISVSA